ncbi:MAG: glycoside hydrolase family 88 protein, partial [Clostridia bacterium]|nr:glycoside hydrolase family 88 protein [Clostridia bacterium]
ADGRWYQVTNRPDDERNWPENSCTCLYAAAICKSVRLGLMDGSCLEKARKAYEGVIRSLKQDGKDLLIGDVCIGTGVGDLEHYLNRPTSVNDLHGVGAFLIMCAECARAGI